MLQETAKEEGEHPTVYVSDIYKLYIICSCFLCACMPYMLYSCMCYIYCMCTVYAHLSQCVHRARVCVYTYPVHEQRFIMCVSVCVYMLFVYVFMCVWVGVDICGCACACAHVCVSICIRKFQQCNPCHFYCST